MNTYAVIMAGGGGTRFWPLSRQKTPKQLLNLSGNDLMINETIDRISFVIPKEHIFIVTNEEQAEEMRNVTKGRIVPEHILSEPAARNTSACIGYAAIEIMKAYGDGVMCVFPADHYIKDTAGFTETIKKAISAASDGNKLVTIGITPTFPSTGYGYIKYAKNISDWNNVEEFKEKPDLETARSYLESGSYLWNSGMFVWKASVILKAFERYLPEVNQKLLELADALDKDEAAEQIQKIYPQIPSISIDYGIMERADQVVVVPGNFGWNDVGSWDMMNVLHTEDENKNVIIGDQINIDTVNTVSYSTKRTIATLGVSNLIIVETEDSLLVCDKSRAQDIKLVVDKLKSNGKTELL